MSDVLLKFPLVAIFVWVARARTFLNTDQEMGEFMSQAAVRQSGLPRNRGQGVASVAVGASGHVLAQHQGWPILV